MWNCLDIWEFMGFPGLHLWESFYESQWRNCLRCIFESFAFFVVFMRKKELTGRAAMVSDTQRGKWTEGTEGHF